MTTFPPLLALTKLRSNTSHRSTSCGTSLRSRRAACRVRRWSTSWRPSSVTPSALPTRVSASTTSAGGATWSRCLECQSGTGKHGWRDYFGVVVGTYLIPVIRRLPTDSRTSIVGAFFSYGAGTQFPRNPCAEDALVELAAELVHLENSTD